ncbi:hypothetical protein ES705_18116 [subsurface metagenome]
MKRAIWISYDLGIKGDYQGLYSWLDDHEAIECGNSVAFIRYEYKSNLKAELKKDLKDNVEFKPGDRIYIVRRVPVDGKKLIRGNFIFGKRKSNPWEGYGSKIDDTIDGDE